MLKDITLGQYFPGNSLAHRLDPRTKLILTVLYIVILFCAKGFVSYGVVALLLLTGIKVSGVAPRALVRGLKPILSMIMSIALRFIPTLIEETDKIMSAQKARGADFESGNLLQRARALVPILVPLFISAFRRADELAVAMECRCYHGGEGRTKLHVLRYQLRDYLVLAAYGGVLAAVLILARLGM